MGRRIGRVGLASTLVAALVIAVAPAAGSAPALTVSPNTGLLDGQTVTVTASGLPAKASYSIQECQASSMFQCDEVGARYGATDSTGALSVAFTVDAVFTPFRAAAVDCRATSGTCELVAQVFESATPVSAAAALAFTPGTPLRPPPAITVNPATNLVDGLSVRVSGHGFRPHAFGQAIECTANAHDFSECDATSYPANVDAQGRVSTDFPLAAQIDLAGTLVDCRKSACELVVTQGFTFDSRLTARVPLAFSRNGPLLPPPVLRVTPSRRLVDRSVVQVTGSGLRRQSFVTLAVCAGHTAPPRCRIDYTASHRVDTNGNLVAALTVQLVLRLDGGGLVDCRRTPGCYVAVLSGYGTRFLAAARLEFAPGAPDPVFPVLTIGARGPFADRQVVPLTGSGFRAGSTVGLTECTLVRGLPDQCGNTSFQNEAVADSHGNFATKFMVTNFLSMVDGSDIDCRRVTCAVVTQSFRAVDDALPGFTTLALGPSAPRRGRYLDQTFRTVDVRRGIIYRHASTSHGAPVDLALDVYSPAHDSATHRPVIMLMFGGYFAFGDRTQLETLARSFALRGYVVINIDYRTRPELFTTHTGDYGGAISDAQDDARAAVVWIRGHATALGIDERAIVAMGWSAGAITALNLAHPWRTPAPPGSNVAAAVSMAGLMLGQPVHPVDPPSLAFGGNHDSVLSFDIEVSSCGAIRAGGASCDMVAYAARRPPPTSDACAKHAVPCTYVLGADEDHSIPFTERHDIVERTSVFLADHVLRPLGIVHRDTSLGHGAG